MPKLCLQPRLGVVAVFLAQKRDGPAAKARQARHHRLVLAELSGRRPAA